MMVRTARGKRPSSFFRGFFRVPEGLGKVLLLIGLVGVWSLVTGSSTLAVEKTTVLHPQSGKPVEVVAGEFLVKFKGPAGGRARRPQNPNLPLKILSTSPLRGIHRLAVPPGRALEEMVAAYAADPGVEYAEPNYIYKIPESSPLPVDFPPATHRMVPTDPQYGLQWHFPLIGMEGAWDIEPGGESSVVVCVLDTGVAYENYLQYRPAPDLEGTHFVPGWDFVNGDSHPNDDNWHGTFVCGTEANHCSLAVWFIEVDNIVFTIKPKFGAFAFPGHHQFPCLANNFKKVLCRIYAEYKKKMGIARK